MGIELELAVLLGFVILGQSMFAQFEIDLRYATPRRRYYERRGWTWRK